ncbi:MAG: hypothetical protein R3F43_05740 [bacterium]
MTDAWKVVPLVEDVVLVAARVDGGRCPWRPVEAMSWLTQARVGTVTVELACWCPPRGAGRPRPP